MLPAPELICARIDHIRTSTRACRNTRTSACRSGTTYQPGSLGSELPGQPEAPQIIRLDGVTVPRESIVGQFSVFGQFLEVERLAVIAAA